MVENSLFIFFVLQEIENIPASNATRVKDNPAFRILSFFANKLDVMILVKSTAEIFCDLQ
jgi:hypothetical protein